MGEMFSTTDGDADDGTVLEVQAVRLPGWKAEVMNFNGEFYRTWLIVQVLEQEVGGVCRSERG